MNLTYHIPFRADKNLGKAYNETMRRIPQGDTAVLMDYDVLMLTPTTPLLIAGYAAAYPNAVLVCKTNRISVLSEQLYGALMNEDSDIRNHIRVAQGLEQQPMRTTLITRPISGFLMVVPRSVWERVPFPETGQCLGVDTSWSRSLHRAGVEIRLMESVYVFHTYRMMQGVKSKDHLK